MYTEEVSPDDACVPLAGTAALRVDCSAMQVYCQCRSAVNAGLLSLQQL